MANEKVKVGVGSPEGKRWFVSKYSELVVVVKPEDWLVINGKEFKQKARRAIFKKEIAPRKIRSYGFLGTSNPGGGDSNASVYWGILETQDKEVIEALRAVDLYKTTPQDDRISAGMGLKELSWDPSGIQRGVGVRLKGQSFGPEIVDAGTDGDDLGKELGLDSPQDSAEINQRQRRPQAASVGLKGR